MDNLDRKILKEIQENFPIDPSPYARIGERVGLTEDEVIKRVEGMSKEGVIERISTHFEAKKLGFVSTLVAMKVPDAKIGKTARFVSSFPEVTQAASRSHLFNLWFTITAPSRDRIKEIVEAVEKESGVTDIYILPAVKEFVAEVTA